MEAPKRNPIACLTLVAAQMSRGTGLSEAVCQGVMKNPYYRITYESASLITKWVKSLSGCSEITLYKLFAPENVSDFGRTPLSARKDRPVPKRDLSEVRCDSCFMMTIVGQTCRQCGAPLPPSEPTDPP